MEESVRPEPRETEGRRYRITGVLGKGGFGIVYRGRLEGMDGFVKDVAIKLLTDVDPQPDTLTRFRDEARILGRLRDRAIVSVEPPIRLEGKWAVVMEYVDGCDCRRLLKDHGPFPATVALEIVQEVARSLDALAQHPGDDGQPMRLLHRDLKPANVQLTPTGTVKLLDFGVAHARFAQRETSTTSHIGGTIGYIAPERLDGVEDLPGDVYSLGVMFEELLTGLRPSPGDIDGVTIPTGDEALDDALTLARRMRVLVVRDRPTASEVERVCRELARVHAGISLRDWARSNVRHLPLSDDALVGQTLSETILSQYSRALHRSRPAPSRRPLVAVLGLLLVAVGALLMFVGVGGAGAGLWLLWPGQSAPVPVAVAPPLPGPQPEVVVAPLPVATPAVPAPEPTRAAPTRPRTPAPAPAPEPEPAPAVPTTGTVSVDGADKVELVGPAGTFPPGELPAGSYTVRATFAGETVPAGTVTVIAGGAVRLRCDARFKRCLPR